MTKREFFKAVASTSTDADIVAFAQSEIAKLDDALARRKTSPAAQRAEAEKTALRAQLFAALTDEPQSAAQIGTTLDIPTAQVSATLCRMDGVAIVDFKPTGKGRAVKGYSRG